MDAAQPDSLCRRIAQQVIEQTRDTQRDSEARKGMHRCELRQSRSIGHPQYTSAACRHRLNAELAPRGDMVGRVQAGSDVLFPVFLLDETSGVVDFANNICVRSA